MARKKFNSVVSEVSLLNGVKEKGLSKNHIVNVKNYLGATSERFILKKWTIK